ncbi:hypothetical protein MKX57_19640 [Lysinibacillus sp. FSL M8-0216]|uniref:hypothetical protein n=1 Tax=Lysinibacillus sp. FSL M8-0216 TaxID=2921619 RepID=UPI00315A82D3
MKPTKYYKQFKDLQSYSLENTGNAFCVQIQDEILLSGLTKTPVKLHTALLILQKDTQSFVKGCFDEKTFEFSSIGGFKSSSNIYIGVDCRKKENNVIYVSSEDFNLKISSKRNLNSSDRLYIYWEYENTAALTLCTHDPVTNDTVREHVFATTKPLHRLLKSIVRDALPRFQELDEEGHFENGQEKGEQDDGLE